MEGREDKVSSFSKCDRGFHGLQVTHLSNDDDIRIFTEDRLDAIREAIEVLTEFSLMHEREMILIDEFYRIFERDDMPAHRLVDEIEHRRHGCGFPTSSWTSDEDDSFLRIGGLEKVLWEHDGFCCRDDRRDGTERDAHTMNDM